MKVITYLINLDGSHERLERATQQLDAVNWPLNVFLRWMVVVKH